MKNIMLISLLILGLWGCQDDEATFDISMSKENLSFRPTAGGAMMYYELPVSADVLAIRVRYTDAFGQEIMRTGSYACDSLQLVGFNEAQKGVQARITLCDRNNVESEPIEVVFDTEDSGPVAFFKDLEVTPSWNGFKIKYTVSGEVNGMAHVLYVGKNPQTQEPDTLLVKSFVIEEGTETRAFSLQQSAPANQIVIRTEDFRGYIVKQKIWENVEAYNTAKLDPSKYEFKDPFELSIEDSKALLGKEYLFDGDTKGETCFGLYETYKTYLAGPGCVGKPLFILDLKEPKLVSEIRLYAMLYMRDIPYYTEDGFGDIWDEEYMSKLPCDLTVYGSNDKDNENSWQELYHFKQDPELERDSRWCFRCIGGAWKYQLETRAEVESADPSYISLPLSADGEALRYMKIVVNKTFVDYYGYERYDQYVTLHELEVYTKKD